MPSTTKNTPTAGQTTARGSGLVADANTGNVLNAHAVTATGHHHERIGRSRPASRNVNSGFASSNAIARINTGRGGLPTNRRTNPSTNSIPTDANTHTTSRRSGSRPRRYRHDTQEKINANSDVTRISAMGTSVPPAGEPGNRGNLFQVMANCGAEDQETRTTKRSCRPLRRRSNG